MDTKRPAPRGTSDDLGTVLEFLRLVWRLNHAVEKRSRRMLASYGITAQQRMVVRLAGSLPGCSPSDLAALLHVDPGTLSSLLAKLESAAIIRRRPDRADARRVRVELTRRGHVIDHEAGGTVESAVQAVLARAPARSIEITRTVLSALADELELDPATVG